MYNCCFKSIVSIAHIAHTMACTLATCISYLSIDKHHVTDLSLSLFLQGMTEGCAELEDSSISVVIVAAQVSVYTMYLYVHVVSRVTCSTYIYSGTSNYLLGLRQLLFVCT